MDNAKKFARNFEFRDAAGRKVFIAGSFNNWKEDQKPLIDRDNTGVYKCRLFLKTGEYQYKFIVDGEWRLDQENPNFISNDFGTLNSVFLVDGPVSPETVKRQTVRSKGTCKK